MSSIVPLLVLFLCLAGGMLLGRTRLAPTGRLKSILMSLSLYALLFFMGFRIGRSPEASSRLAEIGLLSISFAVATTAGTVLVLRAILPFLQAGDRFPGTEEAEATGMISWHHFREPLLLLGIVLGGFGLGLVGSLLPNLTGENLTSGLLYLLILLIGIELARSGISIPKVLAHPRTLAIPAGTVIGSLLGGGMLSLLFPISLGKTLALASGLGWYSLSGVIITDLGDPVLGSAGFMANMIRETIALLTIPFFARTRYPLVSIGVGGATSMDVTLPLIERTCGPSAVPVAIASGAICSLLVPILVPLFYHLG